MNDDGSPVCFQTSTEPLNWQLATGHVVLVLVPVLVPVQSPNALLDYSQLQLLLPSSCPYPVADPSRSTVQRLIVIDLSL